MGAIKLFFFVAGQIGIKFGKTSIGVRILEIFH